MDCQDINNKSSNSIQETLHLLYTSIIWAVTITRITPSPPPPPLIFILYIIHNFIFYLSNYLYMVHN